jgi:hypothetical protein
MRSWTLYAHDNGPTGLVRYAHFGHKRYVELHGLQQPIVEVEICEDPQGNYWGWLDKDAEKPTMIWGSEPAFSMCFPYGPQVEVERGKGEILKLSVKPI